LIAKAQLQGIALQLVQLRESLSHDVCSYAELKEHLVANFTEKMPAHYHYTKLQDATQEKRESVEEFADRCRRLCQKTIRCVEDEAMQRIIKEEAQRRLVAAYINGLAGLVGQQVRFRMPFTLEEALEVAVTVSNTERMRTQDTKRMFSTKMDSWSQGIICLTAEKGDIMRGIVRNRARMGPLRGIVALAIRQEAGGGRRLTKRRGISPLGEPQRETNSVLPL